MATMFRVSAEGRSVTVGGGEVVVGRSPYCSLVVEHESVSRVHASFRLTDDALEVTDLGSSNGTFVRGRRIDGPTRVGPGDDVVVGRLRLTIDERRQVDERRQTTRRPTSDPDDEPTLLEGGGDPAGDADPSSRKTVLR